MGVTGLTGKGCIVAGRGPIAEAVMRELVAAGATVALIHAEESVLGTEAGAVAAVQRASADLDTIDVLVTAFDSREDRPFLELDEELWNRTLEENLKSAFLVGRECAKRMVAAGHGTIVHVGSDLGLRPGPGTAAYAAAKAGVHLLTTCMALDLAPDGVRVCAVAAADAATGSSALPAADAEDVAAAVAFCASDAASYVLGSTFFLGGPLPVRG